MAWTDLYERAQARSDAAAGYYNHNIRLDTADGPVIVRIPIHGADIMDLRIWREEPVLTAIAPYVRHAPHLLFTSTDPPFQVHQYIHGEVLNDIAPRGVPVPDHVTADVVALFSQLTRVPREKLPRLPDDWPADGDCTAFARRLHALTQQIYDTYREEYADLYAAFGVPTEPLAAMEDNWPRLTSRPFVCVHADVHRKNMIVDEGVSTFLDWELALWGDPVYDLAVHIHKMQYLPGEHEGLIARWLTAMPADHTADWKKDLDAYLAHERIKSTIVDAVRYSQVFANGGPYPYPPPQVIDMMTAKINAARVPWGIKDPITAATVAEAFHARTPRPH
ncbi:hypothetical protein Acsp03_63760 [Actinomadura sp. NBRC 104412]|uniref:phosphotransferase family protein n=1 Tax=Actinomadura sp. NBRC 104412 TaxID=3032203 RepID=UPI0024A2602A|nr:aminoglycoside phosphotransferase family protein [Actinomadura sp. NBRC 104412]GLZ08910.1 hypothetical protein Acsp03_63760 [Actinomadura sp. NBRC 104412]